MKRLRTWLISLRGPYRASLVVAGLIPAVRIFYCIQCRRVEKPCVRPDPSPTWSPRILAITPVQVGVPIRVLDTSPLNNVIVRGTNLVSLPKAIQACLPLGSMSKSYFTWQNLSPIRLGATLVALRNLKQLVVTFNTWLPQPFTLKRQANLKSLPAAPGMQNMGTFEVARNCATLPLQLRNPGLTGWIIARRTLPRKVSMALWPTKTGATRGPLTPTLPGLIFPCPQTIVQPPLPRQAPVNLIKLRPATLVTWLTCFILLV